MYLKTLVPLQKKVLLKWIIYVKYKWPNFNSTCKGACIYFSMTVNGIKFKKQCCKKILFDMKRTTGNDC